MKATLEYSLPEEQYEFETAVRAHAVAAALAGFRQYLRDKEKHGDRYPTIMEVRAAFHEQFEGLLDP